MLTNHILNSVRTLKRNKTYLFINVIGLSMSIACAAVIYVIVKYELSFDKHQTNYDTIYRVVIDEEYANGELDSRATSFYPMAQAVRDEIPDFEEVVFMEFISECYVALHDETKMQIPLKKAAAFVDQEFLSMFDLNWVQGESNVDFSEPNCVILSESLAQKLFADSSSPLIGELISLDDSKDLKVVGIVEDPPSTTEFPFQMLISSPSLAGNSNYDDQEWGMSSANFQTYVKLTNPNYVAVGEKLSIIEEKYLADEESLSLVFSLQPLSDIHYNENYSTFVPSISMTNLWTLIIIGALLILIATINFVNLTTAKALKSIKETGIRKVLGSSNGQIRIRLLVENSMLVLASVLVSYLLSNLLLTYLKEVVGIQQKVFMTLNWSILIFYGLALMFVVIISGTLSSVVQLRLKFIDALKNQYTPGSRFRWLKKGMITFQFIVTQALIVATIIIFQQIQFYNNKDLGFETDAILTIQIPGGDVETSDLELFKNKLLENPAIQGSTLTFGAPMTRGSANSDIIYQGDIVFPSDFKMIDLDYIELFDLQLLAGRGFLKNDSSAIVVNEEFIRKMGINDPIDAVGQTVKFWDNDVKSILGVVENFHTNSFRRKIPPIFLYKAPWYREINVKMRNANSKQALVDIGTIWEAVFPNRPFDYQHYDEVISNLYSKDRSLSFLINLFCVISIVISCLGLYGLVTNQVIQKTKEIGIRKVLGATMTNLISILSKEFVILTIIALCISIPISYKIMSSWLDDFAYRISLNSFSFVIAGVISILLSAISIGNQAIVAASRNPVDSLKDE